MRSEEFMQVSSVVLYMTLNELPFFAEVMSSTIVIGLIGKLFLILSLQPFHEMYCMILNMMTLQSGQKKRVTIGK